MALDSSTLIPISNVIDSSIIEKMDPKSPEFKRFMVSLIENMNSVLLAVNAKDVGIYNNDETLTGQNYFDDERNEQRPVYRKVINFGALKNAAGNTQVAHGLDNTWEYKFTRIYGVASDSTNKIYLPIPYSSATAADIIELYVDQDYINITVGKDRSTFDTTYVVIEYCEF